MKSVRRLPVVALCAATVAALPAGAQALTPPKPRDSSVAEALRVKAARSYVDVRGEDRSATAAAPPALPAATRAAQRAFGRRAGADAAVALDGSTGTVRGLQRFGDPLSGALPGATAVRGWARDNAALLGLTGADVDALGAPRTQTTPSGIRILRFGQSAAGIPAYDNRLQVVLDAQDRVVTAGGSPVRDLGGATTTPAVSAATALRTVARGVGASAVPAVASTGSGARRATRFADGDVARLVWFARGGQSRLAWSLTYDAPGPDVFHAVVDARSGALLRRVNQTKYVSARVVDHYPGAPAGGTQRTVTLDPYLDAGATTLSGPFARTFLDLDDDNQPSPANVVTRDEEVVPGSYAFDDQTPAVGGPCTPKLCSWDPLTVRSWEVNADEAAVQAHWYVSTYHDHLEGGNIGFDGDDGNFEDDDPVVVNANDGASTSSNPSGGLPDAAHVNNANMSTPPDGQSPTMQMYLFNQGVPAPLDPFRSINGDDDASIVYHEYTHGLSNRLVVTADGQGALGSPQSGAMGEAWSDWYAKDFLVAQGLSTDTATPGEIDMGEYTDVVAHSIRTEALDCPVSTAAPVVAACPGPAPADGTAGTGGYTYGDFGAVTNGPEVHADGEIWAQTLWDLRRSVGSARAQQLITDGMRLSVPEPSFLDMRNAILAADQAGNGGANVPAIWTAFAGRGMGYFAAAVDGSDVEPVEDFSTPPSAAAGTGSVTGVVTDRDTGAPAAGVRVGVAGHTSGTEDLSAITGSDGRYTINGLPAGTYPKLAFLVGSGYDPSVAGPVAVTRGGTAQVDQALRYDWAAKVVAAGVTTNDDTGADFGCGVGAVHDQGLGVGWSPYTETAPESAGNTHPDAPPTVTIELARAVDVSAFGMDPSAACGDDETATTKDYVVETSPDGQTFTTAKSGAFAPEDAGRLKEVAPDAAATNVKFVRLTMTSSQGSATGDSGATFRDFSEFAVYGAPAAAVAPPATEPAATPPAGPAPTATPAPAPSPAKPRLTLGTRTRGGKVRYRVRCEATCTVRATLSATRKGARRARLAQRLLQRRTTRLAGRSFTRTLSIQATERFRKVLKRRGVRRLPVTLTVRVTSAAGNRSATRRLTLRL